MTKRVALAQPDPPRGPSDDVIAELLHVIASVTLLHDELAQQHPDQAEVFRAIGRATVQKIVRAATDGEHES
jgi:hypothetical protein